MPPLWLRLGIGQLGSTTLEAVRQRTGQDDVWSPERATRALLAAAAVGGAARAE
jgi:hypothetical protein